MVKDNLKQKILIVGTGYVGLVTGAGMAKMGHDVSCYDIDSNRIGLLKDGVSPFFEPGLEDLVKDGIKSKTLEFYDSLKQAYRSQRYVIFAVQTPQDTDGSSDLGPLMSAVSSVAKIAKVPTLAIIKSTVPIGTFEQLEKLPEVIKSGLITFVSCPEFLSEGAALKGFFHPARTIVGSLDKKVSEEVAGLFHGLGGAYVLTDPKTAQIIKYASNTFLAVRVAFINDLSQLCERIGVNARDVSEVLIQDPRLGTSHLKPGMCFDGPCLPKDVSALISTYDKHGLPASLLRGVKNHNQEHLEHIIDALVKDVKPGDSIAIYGISFKPGTDDVRNAYVMDIIERILEQGIKVVVTDPVAIPAAKRILSHEQLSHIEDPYEAAEGTVLQAFFAPWEDYKAIDLVKLSRKVKSHNIYDVMQVIGRNEAEKHGFKYRAVGDIDSNSNVGLDIFDNPSYIG